MKGMNIWTWVNMSKEVKVGVGFFLCVKGLIKKKNYKHSVWAPCEWMNECIIKIIFYKQWKESNEQVKLMSEWVNMYKDWV